MDYCKVPPFFLQILIVYLVILVFVGVINSFSSSPTFLASRDGCFYYALKE
nr:MAG TPA: envelope protein [Caudoviricetes sp.]